MVVINHVLFVRQETAEILSDGIIRQAAEAGLGLILNDESGLKSLTEGISNSDMERLSHVLPQGVSSAKANGILHKLSFKLNGENSQSAVSINKDAGRGSY